MKRLLLCATVLLTILYGCGGSSTGEGQNASLTIAGQTSISFPAAGGEGSVTVNWVSCKWKASESGEGILSGINPVYAGTKDNSGQTDIRFTVGENRSENARSTSLVIADVEGKASVTVNIRQEGVVVVPPEPVKVTVKASSTFQTIDGFGGMNLGANWGAHDYWSESETDLLMGTLGLSIMRIRISPNEGEWSRIVATCKYAVEKYDAKILASPWSMPASMKDNGSLNGSDNGVYSHLKRESYEDYARYLERFAKYMKDAGAPLHAVSVQNEPDWPASYEGCLWSADNHKDFLADYGGLIESALVASGESLNTNHSFYEPALKDAAACGNLDIVAGHLYGAEPKSFNLVAEKGKRLWMTEHLLNDSWTNSTDHWDETMAMVHEMNQCMLNGWNAYIWWYARRYYSLIGDGEEGTARGNILPRGQAFGQFSRYIKAGSQRIGSSVTGSEDIEASAFKTPDGKTVLIIINNSKSIISEVTAELGASAASASATVSSRSAWNEKVSLKASGNSVSLSLPAQSITSIVL